MKKQEDFSILNIIRDEIKDAPKSYKLLIGIIFVLLEIMQFFSGTNWREIIAGIIAFLILIICNLLSGKLGNFIKKAYICLMLVCLLLSLALQKPFLGLFSDQRMQQKFYNDFAEGLYEYSIGNYNDALQIFRRMKHYVPEEEKADYYYWYLETACRKGDETILIEKLIQEIPNKIKNPNDSERKFVFNFLPISRMIEYLNAGEIDKLKSEAVKFENSGEQMFVLLEMVALSLEKQNKQDIERMEDLLVEFPKLSNTFSGYQKLRSDLLNIIGACWCEENPEFTIIILSKLFEEDKCAFFESYLLYYNSSPEMNPGNVRFMLLENLQQLKEIFSEGWEKLKTEKPELFKVYSQSILELGYYLGVVDVLYDKYPQEKQQVGKVITELEQIVKKISTYAMVYNILPIGEEKYIFIILEDLYGNEWKKEGLPVVAQQAHFYEMDLRNSMIKPIVIDDIDFQQNVAMDKFFLMEPTGIDSKYLIESIEGTGEFLNLNILDLSKMTCENLNFLSDFESNNNPNYHTDFFSYRSVDFSCQFDFQIANYFDGNMAKKVGGSVEANIDFEKNLYEYDVIYPDPAVRLYAEKRNENLIFPLENFDHLGGRKIIDKTLLKKIRENKVPYYVFSKIQQSYYESSAMFSSKLSGLMVVYDGNTEDEVSYFYFVKSSEEDVELLGIYKVTDRGLRSVFK